MGDDQVRRMRELFSHNTLHRLIRLIVETRRRFVKDEDPAVANEGAGERDQLPLTLREVCTTARDGGVEVDTAAVLNETRALDSVPEGRVVVFVVRVEVGAKGAGEESRILQEEEGQQGEIDT